jgi:hypothetical protein
MPHQARQPASSPAAPIRPPPGQPAQQPPSSISLQALAERGVASNFTALLGWIDRLGGITLDNDKANGGFDGQALTEIGITNGSLTIDDRRNGGNGNSSRSACAEPAAPGGAQRAVGKPTTAMGAERGADTRCRGIGTCNLERRVNLDDRWRCVWRKPGFAPIPSCRRRSNPTLPRTARHRPSSAL